MATLPALSNGAIRGIFTDAKPARPVVQLINAKAVLQADGSAPKNQVKAEISDGEEFGVAVLTSTVAENLAAGKIGVNDAVCLKNYMVNQLGKTKICIVLDCERTAELGEKVGEPVSWEAAAAPLRPRRRRRWRPRRPSRRRRLANPGAPALRRR